MLTDNCNTIDDFTPLPGETNKSIAGQKELEKLMDLIIVENLKALRELAK
jgi:hypothetical protein